MQYFRRVLRYIRFDYPTVVAALICAICGALLFSMSLTALLPLMKVMIGEEGLHGWAYRSVIKQRTGLRFANVPLPDEISPSNEDIEERSRIPLRVSAIKGQSPADECGLVEGDVVTALTWPGQNRLTPRNRHQQLEVLASLPRNTIVSIDVTHPDATTETVQLSLGRRPVWANTADWFLQSIPKLSDVTSEAQRIVFIRSSIILVILVILMTTLLRSLCRFLQEYLIRRVAFRSIMRLRNDAFHNAIRLPLIHFSTQGVSDTMSRFIQDSVKINVGIVTLLGRMITEPLIMIFLACSALVINAKLTAIVIMGAPAAAVVIGKLGRKMRRATRRTLQSWSLLLGRLQESFFGIRVVKGYHQEEQEAATFAAINTRLLKQQYRIAKINAASGPLLEALGVAAACVGMIFAAYWLTDSRMTPSEFFVLVGLLAAMAESGRKLGKVLPRLQEANAAAERVYFLIDTPAENDPADATQLQRLQQSLTFKNITFSYPNTLEPALRNVNLDVNAGETIAVVGPNGSGKTTLVSLIPRFFLPQKGQIRIDGQDIANVSLASLRKQIGIVTQQTVVFNDTIAANIAYSNPDASCEEIVAAAKQAYAHEFIEQLAQGYDTIVGEQGATLSGGQLQRLAIARAILRDPAILIFDEATSQIDSDSEAKIQQAVINFAQGRTCFIIAHRLSTITHADRIAVFDQGQLVASGKHQQLLDTCDIYRQLYQVQFAFNPAQ